MKLDVRHPATQLVVIAAVTLAGYGRTLGRTFVSEDFVILRLLTEGPFWETVRAQFFGPWLELEFVRFYRPASTLILQLEAAVWGTWAPGYGVAHFAVHLANVCLLYYLARLLGGSEPAVPFAAALVFAVYPLHPNTVIFIASFATLFATTACLASLLLFLRPGGRTLGASAACFAAALLCYEGAAVLPVLLVAADLLRARDGRRQPTWPFRLGRYLPFAGLLGVYFAVRQTALGSTIGGYRQLQTRLASGDLEALAGPFRLDWTRLLYPSYGSDPAAWVRVATLALLAAGTLLGLARLRSGRYEARLWLLGVLWIVVSQLPFGAASVVPANGRYWYLPAAGLGLLLAAAASAVAPRRWRGRVTAGVSLALGALYLNLLIDYSRLHREAAETARQVQGELLRRSVDDARPVFVLDHPRFVRGSHRAPVAQVFHWGLSDALQPPFVEREVPVYPLPPLPPAAFQPLLERPDLGRVWRWDAAARALRPLAVETRDSAGRIPVLGPSEDGLRISFEPTGGRRYRLVVLAQGHPAFPVLEAEAGPSGRIEASLPVDFVCSMRRLYRGEIFWWIAGESRGGRPGVFSELRVLDRPGC